MGDQPITQIVGWSAGVGRSPTSWLVRDQGGQQLVIRVAECQIRWLGTGRGWRNALCPSQGGGWEIPPGALMFRKFQVKLGPMIIASHAAVILLSTR